MNKFNKLIKTSDKTDNFFETFNVSDDWWWVMTDGNNFIQ